MWSKYSIPNSIILQLFYIQVVSSLKAVLVFNKRFPRGGVGGILMLQTKSEVSCGNYFYHRQIPLFHINYVNNNVKHNEFGIIIPMHTLQPMYTQTYLKLKHALQLYNKYICYNYKRHIYFHLTMVSMWPNSKDRMKLLNFRSVFSRDLVHPEVYNINE